MVQRSPSRFRAVAAALSAVALVAVGLTGTLSCVAVSTPFRHAPVAASGGGTPDTVVVAVTQAFLNRRGRGAFFEHTGLVLDGIAEEDGYLGHSIRRRFWGHEAWTMTVWRDEAALNRFVRSERHQNALRAGMPALRAAKFLRLTWPGDQVPPAWSRALAELESVEAIPYSEPDAQAPAPPAGTMAR